jgi:putative N-acetylmannosamine-6-phosphate epimerase
MPSILSRLRGQLIVSCQPVPGGPMDRPEIVAAFAQAALEGGAAGLRIEGIENLRAVRRVTAAPVIGLIKRTLPESPIRITPYIDDVRALVGEGADIIAFDATARTRPEPIWSLVSAIRALGRLAMADCACAEDGRAAHDLGVEILGSTMSGYTGGAVPEGPDLRLVADLADIGGFVLAEGRYHTPHHAALAIAAGASAVVAGSAITRTEHVTSWFVQAIGADRPDAGQPDAGRGVV